MLLNERVSIEDVLDLARRIAVQLEPIVRQAADTQGLSVRLAQAHALGLVDQLCEMAAGDDANARSALRVANMLDDDARRAG